MVAPASGATEIPVPEATVDMWLMAQLDEKEESERRRQEAAGAEDQQTTQAVAAISIAVGAAAAAGSRPAYNEIQVERR